MTARPKEALKEPALDAFLTTREVAELYGITQADVQKAIKKNQINAQKVGYFYLIWEPGLPDIWPSPVTARS